MCDLQFITEFNLCETVVFKHGFQKTEDKNFQYEVGLFLCKYSLLFNFKSLFKMIIMWLLNSKHIYGF